MFTLSKRITETAEIAEALCCGQFREIDAVARENGEKVLKAFMDNKVSDIHLKGTTGYGYGDDGRDKLDAVFAQVLGAEDALVRPLSVTGITRCRPRFSASQTTISCFRSGKPTTLCRSDFGEASAPQEWGKVQQVDFIDGQIDSRVFPKRQAM